MPIEILNKLPKQAKTMWETAYNSAKVKYGNNRASKIAWAVIKEKFKKIKGLWVAKSKDFGDIPTVHYEFQMEGKNISKASNDEYVYYDYILSSTGKDEYGKNFSEFSLKRAAELINEKPLMGYATESGKHDIQKKLLKEGKSYAEIEEEIQNMDTGIKAISANYKDGKLRATIEVRKDLEEMVDNYKGASVEAWIPEDKEVNGEYLQAKLTGFILTPTPSNTDAVRVEA